MQSIVQTISRRNSQNFGCSQGEEVEDVDNAGEASVNTKLTDLLATAMGTNKKRAKAAGKKVMIFTSGTRGDVQPFVALADALQKAGFTVQVATNVNHVAFLQKFNLTAIPCGCDFEALLKQPKMNEAMSKGDVFKFLEGLGEENKKLFPEQLSKMLAAIDAFKPDLMLTAGLHMTEMVPVAHAKKIPIAIANLQCIVPSKYQTSCAGEPGWCPHKMCGYLVLSMFLKGEADSKNEVILTQFPEAKDYVLQSTHEIMLMYLHPVGPMIYGISHNLFGMKPDWSEASKKQSFFNGFWVVSKEVQKQRLKRQDSKFGGGAMPELTAFINAGDTPPVYMGWGSMKAVSPEFMATLAVRSLMKAKLRGIILGGWAELSADKLKGQPDAELYCQDNVLFLKTAPHEWLFPQCSVTVHHGGSGTTAAALRSGVPTVITPVFGDQFDNGLLAQNNGAGLTTCQLGKLTDSKLAAALTKCTSDKDIIKKAEELGEKLRNEDGLGNAIKVLDDWIEQDIISGEYAARVEQRKKEIAKLRSRPSGCFYYFGKICCSCGKTDWSVNL